MAIKSFRDTWTKDEIAEYVRDYNILVLFEEDWPSREAIIVIHSKISAAKKDGLREKIIAIFGGRALTDQICDKVNEYAVKWFNKVILQRKSRVVNSRSGR